MRTFNALSRGVFYFLAAGSLTFMAGAAPASPTRYDQVKDALKDILQKFPQNAQAVVVGDSDSGEKVVGLAIGHGPAHNLVVATHHGNEYGSTVVAVEFARALAQNPIADQTVYVVPVLNISGYNANNRMEAARGSTFDPNRDYPGPCGTEGPFKLRSTAGLAAFIAQAGIVASATLHTFSPIVAYPWGFSTRDTSTPYDSLFIQLAHVATRASRYPVGNSAQAIYPADGTYEDYAFWKLGIWSLLFELGTTHSPSQSQLAEMVRGNVPGLHDFLVAAPKQRAPDHDFKGRCSSADKWRDRHDE